MNSILLVSLIFIGISFLVSSRLKSKFSGYARIPLRIGWSGREVAEKMLRDNRIFDVKVVSVEGR
jgi:Zn-dependent membrane protease YugP